MGEGGDHVLDGVADGVGVLVVHLPGVADKAVCLLLMDRSCMFSPQRKTFYFFTYDLFSFFHSAASHPVCIEIQVSLSVAHVFINLFSVHVRRGLACAPDVLACIHSLTHA